MVVAKEPNSEQAYSVAAAKTAAAPVLLVEQ
jgi:hypothetical protein